MSADLGGLLLLNALFLAAGAGVAAACGWWRGPRGLYRSLGVSYLCGVATFGVVAQLLYVSGASLARWQVLAVCLVPAAAGLPALLRRDTPEPPPRSRWLLLAIPIGLFLLLVAVDLWYQPLWHYDAWTLWTPKAHALWALNGLDTRWFTGADLISKDYPLLLPSVEAAGFRFTGYEAQLLDLQSWLFVVAFVRAVYELGARRARPELLWGAIAMLVVAPAAADELAAAQADVPLAALFGAAGLCGLVWLAERRPSALALAAVLGAGAAATKVEGTIFVAALFASLALAAGWRAWRSALWPLAAGAAALGAGIVPWRLWMHAHGIASQASPGRVGGLTGLVYHADRIPVAAGYLLWRLLDPTAWLLLAPLGVLAVWLVAARWGRAAWVVGGTALLSLAGLVLAYWSTPLGLHYQLTTSAHRVVTGPVFFLAGAAPLVLGRDVSPRRAVSFALERVPPEAALAASAAITVACEAATSSYARYGIEAAAAAAALVVCLRRGARPRLWAVLGLAALLPAAIAVAHIARGFTGDIDVASVYPSEGRALLDGHYPHAEYPPGAIVLFAVESALGGARHVNPFLLAPCNLAIAWAVAATGTRWSRLLVAAVAVWPLDAFFWEYKFDLLPSALLAVGLVAAYRSRWTAAGILLGLGTAVKWSPGVAVALLALWLLAARRTREAACLAVAALAAWAVVVVPFLLWSPGAVWASVTRQAPRGLTPESLWYLPLKAIGKASQPGAIYDAAAAPHWANTGAVVLQLAVLAALATLLAVRRPPIGGAVAAAGLGTAVFLLANKVFSSQYVLTLVAVWLVALAVVPLRLRALLAGVAAAGIASAANLLVYPVGRAWEAASVLLFVCGLALTGALAWVAAARRGEARG